MGHPRAARDLASHVLAFAVGLLPGHRSDWGLAMQAELAALDGVRVRRRYALGCARAVLSQGAAVRAIAVHAIALTFGVVAFAFAASVRVVGVRIETMAFVVVLGVVAWSGRRGGPLGPVAEDRLAQRIRGGGYAVLGTYTMLGLASLRSSGNLEHKGGVWMLYLAVALYLSAVLCATARRTAARTGTLQLTSALTVAGLAAWWIPMLALATVRADAGWALLSSTLTVLLGLAAGSVLRWPRQQVRLAALAAGVATSLLIFLAAQWTFLLLPHSVPDVGFVPGMTAAGHVQQNRAEAIDPYVSELFFGALLAALLIAASTATTRVPRPGVDPRVG